MFGTTTRHGLLCLAAALTAFAARAADPPELMTCELACEFVGEVSKSGASSVDLVPAPEQPNGIYSLRMVYRLSEHRKSDWLDCAAGLGRGLDLSASPTQRLWIRSEQACGYLHVKVVDPDNPGGNHAALEDVLSWNDGPLPAGTWVPLDLQLPAAAELRDAVSYIGFYVASSDSRVPLGQDLVFHVGRFPYEEPERPPWPPQRKGAKTALTSLYADPLAASGPWKLVSGDDNQTDHTAEFADGRVTFCADANGWNEFLWSDPTRLKLAPKTTYRLAFSYEVLASPSGAKGATFYSLVRTGTSVPDDVGWQRWADPAGTQGRRLVTFTTKDAPDYRLIFGVRHQGTIRISDVAVWEVREEGGAE